MVRMVIDIEGILLDDSFIVTLTELKQLCGSSDQMLECLVAEGVLCPEGRRPDEWRFRGREVRRARRALRLQRDLELNPAGTALALELIEEIETLRARLQVLERRLGL